jgi:hypothetical protein
MNEDKDDALRSDLPPLGRRVRKPIDDEHIDDDADLPRLGSLAKTARDKHLKTARTTLLVLGILMVVFQTVMYFVETDQVKNELQKEVQKLGGMDRVDQAKLKEVEDTARRLLILFHGGTAMVGMVFIGLSLLVQRYPVPTTIVALAMFIALQIIFAVVNPVNIATGWLFKIITVVCLVKALQAGIAAKNDERRYESETEFGA